MDQLPALHITLCMLQSLRLHVYLSSDAMERLRGKMSTAIRLLRVAISALKSK
jgi:hypothetical protein